MTAARWTLAAGASAAAHAGVLGLGLWAVAPRNEPEAARSETGLRIETLSVAESTARPAASQAEAAPRAEGGGDAVTQGAIPVGRATPAPLPQGAAQGALPAAAEAAGVAEPTAERLAAAADGAQAAPAAETQGDALSQGPLAQGTVEGDDPGGEAIGALPPATEAAGVAEPTAERLAAAADGAEAARAAEMGGDALAEGPLPRAAVQGGEPAGEAVDTVSAAAAAAGVAEPMTERLAAADGPEAAAARLRAETPAPEALGAAALQGGTVAAAAPGGARLAPSASAGGELAVTPAQGTVVGSAAPTAPPAAALRPNPAGAAPAAAAGPTAPALAAPAVVAAALGTGAATMAPVAPTAHLAAAASAAPEAAVQPLGAVGPAVAAGAPPADRVVAAAAGAQTAPPVAPPGTVVTTQAATAPVAVAAPAGAETAPAVDPRRAPAAEAPRRVRPALGLSPPQQRVAGTLAWTGGAEAEMGALSLAAIQAFVPPGDVGAAGGDAVRDGLARLLTSVPCARLQTVFLPEAGALELRGHVPEPGLEAPLLAALRDRVGEAIPVAGNVLVLPAPQCTVLAGLDAAGLPQSIDQVTNPRVVGVGAHARVYDFAESERMEFDLTGPDYGAFVYADYYDAEGMVIHLQPNEHVALPRVGPAERLEIGSGAAGGLELRVTPPFGQEIVVALAASAPLYEGVRPLREAAAPYLDFLRERVAAARAADPEFRGEWVYFFVRTRAR